MRCAHEHTASLYAQGMLSADDIDAESKPRKDEDGRLDAAIAGWNDFDEQFGSFADEHSDL